MPQDSFDEDEAEFQKLHETPSCFVVIGKPVSYTIPARELGTKLICGHVNLCLTVSADNSIIQIIISRLMFLEAQF